MTSAPLQLDTIERVVLETPQYTRVHLPALTAARFFAAFGVLVFHCTAWQLWPDSVARTIASTGYVAVAFFFILSGFILTYTYWTPDRAGIRPIAFYKARLARIYPMYMLALLLALPFYAKAVLNGHGGASQGIRDALLTVTLQQSQVPNAALTWNPPGWSLSTEAFFYLVFPLALPFLVRGSLKRVGVVAALSVIAAIGLPVLYLVTNPDGLGSPTYATEATWLNALRYHPLARLPEFLLGICLARFFLELPVLRAPRVGMLMTVAGAGGVATVLAFADHIPYVLLHNGLLAPAFAALILGLATSTPVTKALSARWIVLLGESSYALYILHIPLFMLAGSVARRVAFEGDESAAFTLAFLVFAIAVSIAAFKAVEVPARRYLLKRRVATT